MLLLFALKQVSDVNTLVFSDCSTKSPSSALYSSKCHLYVQSLQKNQIIYVGGITQSCTESLRCITGTAQSLVELLYYTSLNQTKHWPVSHTGACLSGSQ